MLIHKPELHEFDQAETSIVEVSVIWGTSLQQVYHLKQGENFTLTNGKTKGKDVEFIVGSNILGDQDRIPIVVWDGDETKFSVCKDSILEVNGVERSIKESGYQISIGPSVCCRMKIGNLTIVAKGVREAKKIPYAQKVDRAMLGASIGSALAGAAIIISTHFLVGAGNNTLLIQGNEEDRLNDLRAFIQRQREREVEVQQTPNNRESQEGAASAAHAGPSGQMGNRQAPARNLRHAIRNNGEPPHLSRQAAREAVASRGIFASIAASGGGIIGGASGIVSPFGGLTESGLENQNFNGNLTGDNIGESLGYGGLGPTGTGWGGGGTDQQIVGLGTLNTNGRGGNGNEGFGENHGTRLRNRGTRSPIVRAPAPSVIGLLSPEAIRRVVLRNLPQVIHCHEQGLVQNPTLEGRVVVRFIIGGEGTILGSTVAESNVAVPSVGQCISNAVRRWQFPAPEGGGIVTVNYPFNLQRPE